MAYLKGFGIENFRVFKEHTWFDFAPITILVGPNSSGKSSLIKALLLLKDNYEKGVFPISSLDVEKRQELRFDGPLHNLGNGEHVVSDSNRDLSFSFLRDKDNSDEISLYAGETISHSLLKNLQETVKFEVNHESTYLKTFIDLYTEDGERVFSFSKDEIYFDIPLAINLIESIKSDIQSLMEYEKETNDSILSIEDMKLYELINDAQEFLEANPQSAKRKLFKQAYDEFISQIMINKDGDLVNFKDFSYADFQKRIISNPALFCARFLLINSAKKFHLDKDFQYKAESVFNLIITCLGLSLHGVTQYAGFRYSRVNYHFFKKYKFIGDLKYLPSIKGVSKRSYSSFEDNVINDLIKKARKGEASEIQNFFNKWKSVFGVDIIDFDYNSQLDANYLTVNKRSITDLGFGLSQISAILLTLAIESQSSTSMLLFEEPEANLHPKFQSMLADLFVDIYKEKASQFIIETHSEYLIRKLQYLTAKGEIKPEDTVIYYFNDPNKIPAGEKQVKKINILGDGSLSDEFGPGFYDEADNLAISLFNLQKSRRN